MNSRPYLTKLLLSCLLLLPVVAFSQVSPEGANADPPAQQQKNGVDSDDCPGNDACEDESGSPEQDGNEADSPFGLSGVINAEGLLESWERQINAVLDDYGLSASFLGKLISSLIIALFALIFSYLIGLMVTRLLNRLESFGSSIGLHQQRLKIYRKILMFFIRLAIALLVIVAFLVIWGDPFENFLNGEQLSGAFGRLAGVVLLLVIGVVVFELITAGLEHFFARMAKQGSPRALTLLPIARNVTHGALLLLFGITLISELGVNIMPLLAGAGVVGFAVGFGAQAFIKDIITGFIIIVEDLIQVGDVAGIGGRTGLVEKITIRKVQLRDLNGAVYTIPFSEISVVENLTKGFSYYLMDIGVAYRENTDEVIELLRGICDEMQQEEKYKDNILEPIDILGVDKFADNAVIIKARIKTRPIKQWEVGREFNRRMKQVFDKNNIEIPFPHRTLYFGEGKSGEAPTAKVELQKLVAANDSNGHKKPE